MTSRERMCKVLNHECPDRLPTFDYAIDRKVVESICPGGTYADVVEKLDLDAITAWEPSTGGYTEGLPSREPGDIFTDEWGVRREATGELSAYPLEDGVPIRSETDLGRLAIPDPHSEHRFRELREYVARVRGHKLMTYAIIDMFEISKCLMGFQNFLTGFHEQPTLVRKLLDLTTEWVVQVAQKAIDIGADMIIDLADIAWTNGPFVRPEIIEEFFVPCLQRVVNAVKKRRAYMFYHSHGNIWSVLDMLIDTGIDVIHPLDPDAGMDIAIVKKTFGTKVVVAGNISTNLMSERAVDEIEKITEKTIADTYTGGGHILMASSSILSSVKPENYCAMIKTAHALGRY
jgi:uroporphyrinogen decarboxylase